MPRKKAEKWNGIEALRPHLVKIESITPDPNNARKHSQRNIDTIAGSLEKFGQHRVAVCAKLEDGTGLAATVIIIGSGMYVAAKRLGWTHIAAITTPDDYDTARLRAITDNRSGEAEVGSEWNIDILAEQLSELNTGEWDLSGLGWSAEDLKAIAAWTPDGNDPGGEWQGMPEYEMGDEKPFRTILMHFKDQAAVDEFLVLIGQTVTEKTRYLYHPKLEWDMTGGEEYGDDENA